MAQTLNYNRGVGEYVPFALADCDVDTDNIQQLDDEPNDVGGMTAQQLKEAFDKTGDDLRSWINDDLLPAIRASDATEEARQEAEAERVANEQERVANELNRVAAENDRAVFEPYDESKAYFAGNKVAYNGSSYYCYSDAPIGTLPTDTDHWDLMAAKGTDAISPRVTITTITGGHRVKITDATHPNGQTFTVMDGEDGTNNDNPVPLWLYPGEWTQDATNGWWYTETAIYPMRPEGGSYLPDANRSSSDIDITPTAEQIKVLLDDGVTALTWKYINDTFCLVAFGAQPSSMLQEVSARFVPLNNPYN